MTQTIWLFMMFGGAAFILAALVHFGLLINGYEHQKAGTAEGVIGIVLLVGLGLTWIRAGAIRGIGLAAQGSRFSGPWLGFSRSSSASVPAQRPTSHTISAS